jgi:drug/metabolite transporter (DMT)-like permease
MAPGLRSGVMRVVISAVLFGVAAPAASRLAGSTSAFTLAGLLYLGAFLAVVPAVLRSPPRKGAMQRAWKPLVIAVVAGGAIGPVLLMAGLARTTAATGSLLLNSELSATAVLAAIFFREHLGRRVLTAVLFITLASALLTWEPGARVDIGALLIIAACVAWGLDNCVTATIDHLSPAHVVAVKGLIAGSVNLGLGLIIGGTDLGLSAIDVLVALVIGAGGYGVSIVLWVQGAQLLGATRAQVIFATAPFIGAAVAWIAFGDRLGLIHVAAVVLAVIGVGFAMAPGHVHEHQHAPLIHEHEHRHDDDHHDPGHDGHEYRSEVVASLRHRHVHDHPRPVHAHPHMPDLHHRHSH